MSDMSQILKATEQDDPHAADQLLALAYDELRNLAAQKPAHEKLGQTLQATALVHEAYVRLASSEKNQYWDTRGHFWCGEIPGGRLTIFNRHSFTSRKYSLTIAG